MTYDEIKREIGKRLGDPDLTKYRGLIGNYFLQGVCDLALSGEFMKVEMPYLYRSKGFHSSGVEDPVTASPYQLRLTGPDKEVDENVLKIISIVQGFQYQESVDYLKYIEITDDEYNRMAVDSEMQPLANEVFWFQDIVSDTEAYIRFYPHIRMEETDRYYFLNFLVSPDKNDFNLENDTRDLSERFSNNFIYKLIDYVVARIKGKIEEQ